MITNIQKWVVSLTLLASFNITQAAEPELWQSVMQSLAESDIAQGHFKQSKHLKILKKPIISSGDFALLRDHGLIWNTLKPLDSSIVILDNRIYQVRENKKHLLVEEKQQGVASTLLSILSGNLTVLEQSFEIESSITNDEWSLQLSPKNEALSRIFKLLVLKGEKQLTSARLFEPQGTQTYIEFSQISNKPLNTEQKILLSEPVLPLKQFSP